APAHAHRPEYYRDDRHHSADRHREEERDYDDRFRAGGRTAGGKELTGLHLRSMHASIPAHSHDYHGSDARGASTRTRHRHGLRVAASARNHHHRRTDRQPDADPVYDSRDLLVLRPFATRLVPAA